MVSFKSVFLTFSYLVAISLAAPNLEMFDGEVADITDFPYMVAIYDAIRLRCSGSILNENTILTAAHCTIDYSPSDLRIGYGTVNISEGSFTNVTEIFQHKTFQYAPPWRGDISIIKVDPPLVLSDTLQAVKLPEMYDPTPEYKQTSLAGWGDTETDRNRTILLKVNLTILKDSECEESWKYTDSPVDTDEQLCARIDMLKEVKRGPCWGDGGGPILVDGIQYGIVSYILDYCGNPHYPIVFTKVSNYISWILDKLEI